MSNTNTPNSCQQCKMKGLPILPVRYAAVPAAVKQDLPGWTNGDKVKDIALGNGFHYALRTVRKGYIYLYYDKNARGSKQWECYVVGEDGSLTRQPTPSAATPQSTPIKQCANHGSNNTQVHYLVIDQPEKCGPTWIAFSEYKWADATIAQYTENTRFRNQRMQTIHPSRMIHGAKHSHGAIATQEVLESVLEYNPDFRMSDLPHAGEPAVLSQPDGSYARAAAERISTHHPWYQRPNAAAATVEHMATRTSENGKSHVLALWDAIGITHELNGFFNDAAGRMAQYDSERLLQTTAMASIDGAKKAFEEKAARRADDTAANLRETRAGMRRTMGPMSGYNTVLAEHVRTRAGQQALTRLYWDRANDLITEEEYQRRRDAAIDQHVPEADRAAAKEAMRKHDRDQEILQERHVEDDARRRSKSIDEAWPRYADNLETGKLDTFRNNRKNFMHAMADLSEKRVVELIKWLEAPLFLDALEDFHPEELADGEEFAEVVADVIEGIGATPSGIRHLQTLVGRVDATGRGSLFWRAVALNQTSVKQEVTAALAAAQSGKSTPLEGNDDTVLRVITQLKNFVSAHKKIGTVVGESDHAKLSSGARFLKNTGLDKLMYSAGNVVFRWSGAATMGDMVGEKIIQNLFLLRGGVSTHDAIALVRLQAKVEGLSRQQALARLQTAKTFLEANDAISRQSGNRALREMWGRIRPVDKGHINTVATRITVVVGLIEIYNIQRLLRQTDKNISIYAQLFASSAGLMAAIIEVGAAPYQLLGKTSRGFQKWKIIGGAFSSAAALVGAGVDFDRAADSMGKDQYLVGTLYLARGVMGIGAGGSIIISAIVASAPLLRVYFARVGMRMAVLAVERIAATFAAAAAARVLGILVGWEIALVMIAIQFLIWYFVPDKLEEWCETCVFGKRRFGTPLNDAKKQDDAFAAALSETL